MIKLHARVTKEIEITEEQAEWIVNYLCGCVERCELDDINKMFTEGIDCGYYEAGYIPYHWLEADLTEQMSTELNNYLEANICYERCRDIDL